MKTSYDGLDVIRIPLTNADIFTTNVSCGLNVVQWLEVGGVCVSETVEESCQDTNHKKNDEYITPMNPSWQEYSSTACN